MYDNKKNLFLVWLLLFLCGSFVTKESSEKIFDLWKNKPILDETTENIVESSGLKICFLDVGQAEAALVECEGHFMLIDGGNAADSSKMYKILQDRKIKYIDIIVASHMHEDHVGGLAGALNYASAGTILCSATEYDTDEFYAFKKYAEYNGGIKVPEVGDRFGLGSAVVDILGVNTVEGGNDSSIILKIVY